MVVTTSYNHYLHSIHYSDFHITIIIVAVVVIGTIVVVISETLLSDTVCFCKNSHPTRCASNVNDF